MAKNVDHWPKFWYKFNPDPKILGLDGLTDRLLTFLCHFVPQAITSSMYYHTWLVLSNLANWFNLRKKYGIKIKLTYVLICKIIICTMHKLWKIKLYYSWIIKIIYTILTGKNYMQRSNRNKSRFECVNGFL